MARVQIDLPERFAFSTEITLYMSHINYGGHLDNALLLTIVSEARERYYRARGIERLSCIVADAAVQYKSEGFYGDVLVVEMTIGDQHAKGFDFVYRMTEKKSGREVARGKTGMLFFDFEQRKVTTMPEGFVQQMTS